MYLVRSLVFVTSLTLALPLAAQDSAAPAAPLDQKQAAALFGARQIVQQISLSPDGHKVAYISPYLDRGAMLFVAEIGAGTAPAPIFRSSGDPDQLSNCHWVSNARLLCQAFASVELESGARTYVTRYLALNSDGTDVKMVKTDRGSGARLDYDLDGGTVIDWLPERDNEVLMIRNYIPEVTVGTRVSQNKEGYGVDRVDTVSLSMATVERPKRDAREYITDGDGNVRIMSMIDLNPNGYLRDERQYLYRSKGDRDWKPLSTVGGEEDGFDPYAVDPQTDVAYGLKKLDGRQAAYTKALDGSGTETLVFAHPTVDVSGFARVGRRRSVVGVTYVTDKREMEIFDPGIAAIAGTLRNALPGSPSIYVTDSSQDGNRLLIWAGSDRDPGRYYLFDRTQRQLLEVMLVRPELEHAGLGEMKPITYKAHDGVEVPAYLTLPPGKVAKNLPAIVLPHGGPSARDEWGFDWLTQYFASQGYAVIQPNFRGSAGYGDAWFKENGFQSWQTAIGDVNDAGHWLVAQGIADPEQLAVVGWSYGGYAALLSGVTEPDLFKAIVAIAPVTDLARLVNDSRDFTNFTQVRDFVGTGDHVDAGSPARHAEAIKAPVLLIHGTTDSNVSVVQSRLMQDRLEDAGKTSELILFDGLDHYLDDSKARTAMLSKISAFLAGK